MGSLEGHSAKKRTVQPAAGMKTQMALRFVKVFNFKSTVV